MSNPYTYLKASKKDKPHTLDLYGVVGWNINQQQFSRDLKALKGKPLHINLSTIGGSFYDGLPIYNMIDDYEGHVSLKIMGYCLSMGSHMILAADEVEMAENGLIMIHRAQGGVFGDADKYRHRANILEKHEMAIMPAYLRRFGNKTEEYIFGLLKKETWYTAKEALEAGLIDKITDAVDLKKEKKLLADNKWEDLVNNYQNTPDSFIKNLQESMPKSALEKIINLMPGQPQPLILPENKKEDLEMTKEELQQMLDAQSKKLEESMQNKVETAVAKALEEPELTEEQKEIAALKAQLAEKEDKENQDDKEQTKEEIIQAKEKQIADLQAEADELKKPDGKATPTPENKGDNQDIQYDC